MPKMTSQPARKFLPRKKDQIGAVAEGIADALFDKVHKGNASASDHYELAELYRFGIGIIVNHNEALRLYHLAIDQGFVAAARGISCLYSRQRMGRRSEWEKMNGVGIEKNIEEARKWYRVWEYCYYKKKSIKEGLKWYRRSCPKNEDICLICGQENHNWNKMLQFNTLCSSCFKERINDVEDDEKEEEVVEDQADFKEDLGRRYFTDKEIQEDLKKRKKHKRCANCLYREIEQTRLKLYPNISLCSHCTPQGFCQICCEKIKPERLRNLPNTIICDRH
jgi:hypothetical protein